MNSKLDKATSQLARLNYTESRILEAIQSVAFDQPGVLETARGLSHFGEHALGWMGSSAVLALADKPRRRQWVAAGASAFTAHAASVITKRIVRRKRPDYPYVQVGVSTPSKLSFPSSHATSTTAFLAAAAFITKNPAPLLGVPVMMASRMVLGVHYPTDTVAGALVGATTAHFIMNSDAAQKTA